MHCMALSVMPLVSERMNENFDLFVALHDSLQKNDVSLRHGDILVISTKYVSYSQGRIIHIDDIHDSKSAVHLSKKYAMSTKISEVILRESAILFGGMAGFLITESVPFAPLAPEPLHVDENGVLRQSDPHTKLSPVSHMRLYDLYSRGILAPNAGIDASNAKKGNVILYPSSPFETAEMLRRKIFLCFGVMVGVILADSRLMPTRVGTSAVAVAHAGLNPVADNRSKIDLDGNPLKVTFQATSDNIATIANHAMGEGAESRPFVIVRGSAIELTSKRPNPHATMVSVDQCVYVRGLSACGDDVL